MLNCIEIFFHIFSILSKFHSFVNVRHDVCVSHPVRFYLQEGRDKRFLMERLLTLTKRNDDDSKHMAMSPTMTRP